MPRGARSLLAWSGRFRVAAARPSRMRRLPARTTMSPRLLAARWSPLAIGSHMIRACGGSPATPPTIPTAPTVGSACGFTRICALVVFAMFNHPLSLSDRQLAMLNSAARALPLAERDAFLRGVATRLGDMPNDAAISDAIDAQLALDRLPTFLCDAQPKEQTP